MKYGYKGMKGATLGRTNAEVSNGGNLADCPEVLGLYLKRPCIGGPLLGSIRRGASDTAT